MVMYAIGRLQISPILWDGYETKHARKYRKYLGLDGAHWHYPT